MSRAKNGGRGRVDPFDSESVDRYNFLNARRSVAIMSDIAKEAGRQMAIERRVQPSLLPME